MGTVGAGVFEIRLKDASGIFRVFYIIKVEYGILVFHSFKKKTQKTPVHEIASGQKRLREFLRELKDESEE